MSNHMMEVDRIIRLYRNDLNNLDKSLAPHLPKVSSEAKRFIMEFIECWDTAIRDEGLLSTFPETAIILQRILERFLSEYSYSHMVLYSDIQYFLDVQKREKESDLYKSQAEGKILNDVGVLRFCYEFWKDLEEPEE